MTVQRAVREGDRPLFTWIYERQTVKDFARPLVVAVAIVAVAVLATRGNEAPAVPPATVLPIPATLPAPVQHEYATGGTHS